MDYRFQMFLDFMAEMIEKYYDEEDFKEMEEMIEQKEETIVTCGQ